MYTWLVVSVFCLVFTCIGCFVDYCKGRKVQDGFLVIPLLSILAAVCAIVIKQINRF